jgi:hypothetical protein
VVEKWVARFDRRRHPDTVTLGAQKVGAEKRGNLEIRRLVRGRPTIEGLRQVATKFFKGIELRDRFTHGI